LYSRSSFEVQGLSLRFLKARNVTYSQGNAPFVPFLSIIDVLMFCGKNQTIDMLSEYDFIEPQQP